MVVVRWRRGIGSFVLALASSGAVTEGQGATAAPRPENGAEWLARCAAAARAPEVVSAARDSEASCLAWVEGLIDINEIYRGLGALNRSEEGFCTPASATVSEAADAIVRYLEAHPEAGRFSARILAYMALRGVFPCPPASGGDVGRIPR